MPIFNVLTVSQVSSKKVISLVDLIHETTMKIKQDGCNQVHSLNLNFFPPVVQRPRAGKKISETSQEKEINLKCIFQKLCEDTNVKALSQLFIKPRAPVKLLPGDCSDLLLTLPHRQTLGKNVVCIIQEKKNQQKNLHSLIEAFKIAEENASFCLCCL